MKLLHLSKSLSRRYSSSLGSHTQRLENLPKAYNPAEFEPSIIQKWTKRKRPLQEAELKESFRILFPPPNVTGKLHLGHALTVAIEDTILRLKLMKGHPVEWIPGFDHAGIATHSVVKRKLLRTRNDVNQIELRAEIEKHARINREEIKAQLSSMGALLDWDKEYYTLDEQHSHAVQEAFIQLFDKGVIHRSQGLVNWSFALKSSVADIEVDEISFKGRTTLSVPGHKSLAAFGLLYHIEYPLQNSDKKLVVATSRPETMFGDTAIAVNPEDSRYQEFIGQSVANPINGKIIPVIPDPRVKIGFGTGLVKITPAHDKLDFAIGTDHNLPIVEVFDSDGVLNSNCGEFEGLQRFDARNKVIVFLNNLNVLSNVADYNGAVGLCCRTQDIIEQMLVPHWYFRTKSFTERLVASIQNEEFRILPKNSEDVFLFQMSSVRDWCLSRQIQWGHRIPAYHHKSHPEKWVMALDKSSAKAKLEAKLGIQVEMEEEVVQDPDVLDTWFSSALIPLAVSDWPNSKDFKEISLMETGHDILLFWVWRMAIMTLALTDKLPFHSVLLHGVLVDSYGRKMSKSKGNVIDPMSVIAGRTAGELTDEALRSYESGELTKDEYDLRVHGIQKDFFEGIPDCGADGLRFALLGQDIYDENVVVNVEYLENCKRFCNKLWQAMRLYLHYLEKYNQEVERVESMSEEFVKKLPIMDRWILIQFREFAEGYETNVRKCKFHLLTESIRHFFYAQYCDVYLEFVKLDLKNEMNLVEHLQVMEFVLRKSMQLFHPFLPFVTEEIWSVLTNGQEGLLIDTIQPQLEEFATFQDPKVSSQMATIVNLIKQIRSFKAKYFPGVKEARPFVIELDRQDFDISHNQTFIEISTRTNLKFKLVESHVQQNSITSIIHTENGRICRLSCDRSVQGLVIPKMDGTKLLKLQATLAKLKKQYESQSFQKNAAAGVKERLRQKLEVIQSQIAENLSKEFDSKPDPKGSPS